MGYIHDTAMAQFISPKLIGKSATATMTFTVASNVWSDNRTANNSSFTIYVPIPVPGSSVALKGCYLVSIELMYVVTAAAADDIATVEIYKDTLTASAASGSGAINTAAAIASTIDTGHDTDAERLAQDEHRMKVTLTTPEWIDNDATFHLEAVVNGGAVTEVNIYGAIANYTLRI